MGKNGILKNKAGEQIFPATTADQVAWNDRMNLKQAISEKLGAPYAASTVSSMTDKTRIYVYTGSESGYTKGNWYYWNGSSWVSGGVYNSVAVETDKTLTVADKAADSAIVGQQIGELKESLKNINVDTDKTLKIENKAADANITGKKIETLNNTIGDISNKADYGNNVSEILDYLFENMGTDLPKAIVVSDDSLYIDETETGSFSVKLKSAPKESQNVYITATDPTKCNISPTTLSFSTENYNVEQTVTVTTLADTDTQDDIVTITVNSTGVASKTVTVTILDKDRITLTEDGLVFEADYRNYVSGSETMEDTKAGITIQNIKGFKKVTNGIATDEVTKTYQSMYIDHTQENFQVLKEKMTKCAKNGFTLEAFGTAEVESFGINYKNSFWSDQGTTLLGCSSPGVSETNISNLYVRANAVYKDNSGESQKTVNSNTQKYVDTDGKTKGMNLTTFKFIHVCAVYNKDGTYTAYINGNPLNITNNVTVENWGSWDIDTMFNYHWTMGSSQAANTSDGNFITFQRMYNRPLSLQEIKRNMKYNANECGITSF